MPAAIGGAVTWTLEHFRMWHAFREQKARADKAELELREYREAIRRNREKREFTENIPLYIEAVEVAFAQISKSHPLHPNTVPLSSLARAIDVEKGKLREVLKIMEDTGRITSRPSPFTQGEMDYTLV
jgi:hypothetical protein